MCSVARGYTFAGRMLTAASSAWKAASYAAAISAGRLGLEPRLDQHPVLAAVEVLVAQVADVRDVLHVQDVEAVIQQRPADEIGEQVTAQVPDMSVAVDRRPARVHRDVSWPQRDDRLHGPAQGVAQAQGHGAIVGGTPDSWAGGPNRVPPVYSPRCAAGA